MTLRLVRKNVVNLNPLENNMNELLVKLDFDIDSIFDNEFKIELNYMIRNAVLDEFNKQIRKTTVQIYKEHEIDVSDAVLEKYKQEHAKFEASART